MARVITGNNQIISGRIGDQVHVRYKGGIYVRRAATKRRDANDPKMVQNQQRFAHITRFCVQFKYTLISQIWNHCATKGSGYNLFMKSNSPAFAKDGSLFDPLLLTLAVGDLSLPETLAAQRDADDFDTIRVSWQNEPHNTGTRLRDELMVIGFDGEHFSPMAPTGLQRKDVQGSFNLPHLPLPTQFIYLFFMAEDHRSFSESKGYHIG